VSHRGEDYSRPLPTHRKPPAKSTPTRYFEFFRRQYRTMALPFSDSLSDRRQTLPRIGIGSDTWIHMPASEISTQCPMVNLSSPMVQATLTGPEQGWRGKRRRFSGEGPIPSAAMTALAEIIILVVSIDRHPNCFATSLACAPNRQGSPDGGEGLWRSGIRD
jgi:hypothetical protein